MLVWVQLNFCYQVFATSNVTHPSPNRFYYWLNPTSSFFTVTQCHSSGCLRAQGTEDVQQWIVGKATSRFFQHQLIGKKKTPLWIFLIPTLSSKAAVWEERGLEWAALVLCLPVPLCREGSCARDQGSVCCTKSFFSAHLSSNVWLSSFFPQDLEKQLFWQETARLAQVSPLIFIKVKNAR